MTRPDRFPNCIVYNIYCIVCYQSRGWGPWRGQTPMTKMTRRREPTMPIFFFRCNALQYRDWTNIESCERLWYNFNPKNHCWTWWGICSKKKYVDFLYSQSAKILSPVWREVILEKLSSSTGNDLPCRPFWSKLHRMRIICLNSPHICVFVHLCICAFVYLYCNCYPAANTFWSKLCQHHRMRIICWFTSQALKKVHFCGDLQLLQKLWSMEICISQ